MIQQKYRKNYSNDNCVHKRCCRFIIKGLLDEISPNFVNSITLPALNFELEKQVMSRYNGLFTFCEVNKDILSQQKDIISTKFRTDGRIRLFDEDALNYRNSARPMNLIWFDLCGYLTEDLFIKLLRFLTNNSFDKNGVFAITLMSSRQSTKAQKFYRALETRFLSKNMTTLQNFKSVQLPKILQIALKEYGNISTEIAANYSYKPSSGGGMMSMYAFKW